MFKRIGLHMQSIQKATLVRMAKAEDDEWDLYVKISEAASLNG